jgi:hypothetical protein
MELPFTAKWVIRHPAISGIYVIAAVPPGFAAGAPAQ